MCADTVYGREDETAGHCSHATCALPLKLLQQTPVLRAVHRNGRLSVTAGFPEDAVYTMGGRATIPLIRLLLCSQVAQEQLDGEKGISAWQAVSCRLSSRENKITSVTQHSLEGEGKSNHCRGTVVGQ